MASRLRKTTGGSSRPCPLAARYLQTDPAVTPGEANGAIIFAIDCP
ncbi:hypothetical protein QTI33_25375 [Variovorax sp. J22P271]|nr:hypothetical protein [Variovorax sp. J22P271]MDM0035488.1 hypothetical protein [Variovorax sp. J22P271]